MEETEETGRGFSAGAGGWVCRDRLFRLADRVHLMGILNVTPDSFSDGGQFEDVSSALKRAIEMGEQGADIIDVGGESTRPGAQPVPAAEEMDRVIPVIRAITSETGLPVSIDTMKAEVARAALEAGAVIVNDVSAMRADPQMRTVVAEWGAGAVLMHMLGEPRTMQQDPQYSDVVAEVRESLLEWAREAEGAGVGRESIALDPGIGFGKTVGHNLTLLRNIEQLCGHGYPVLVGPSRKSFIGAVLDVPVTERVEGTAAVAAWLTVHGASILRVHDVKAMSEVVRMTEAIVKAR